MQGTCPSHKGDSLLQLDKAVTGRKTVTGSSWWRQADQTPVPCKKGDVVKFAPAIEPDNCMLPVDFIGSLTERAWKFTPCSTEKSPEKADILFVANKDCEWELLSKPGKCAGYGGDNSVSTYDCGSQYGEKLKLMNQTLIDMTTNETKTGLILVLGELGPRPSSYDASDPSWIWDNRCVVGGGYFVEGGGWCAQETNVLEGMVYWKVHWMVLKGKKCNKNGKMGKKEKLSLEECHAYCESMNDCKFFTYKRKKGDCEAYKTCNKLKKGKATTYRKRY